MTPETNPKRLEALYGDNKVHYAELVREFSLDLWQAQGVPVHVSSPLQADARGLHFQVELPTGQQILVIFGQP